MSSPKIILLFFLISACQTKQATNRPKTLADSSETFKREYFTTHIANQNCNDGSCQGDTTTDFNVFMRLFYPNLKGLNIDDPLIYALEERYIDSSATDKSGSWVRFTIDGTWSIPYCITARRFFDKTYITYKASNGSGGYFPGILWASETVLVGDSVIKAVDSVLSKVNFWSLPHNSSDYCVTDGIMITVESVFGSKYNLVKLYSPTSCGDHNAKQLDRLNFYLQSFINVSQIYDRASRERSGG